MLRAQRFVGIKQTLIQAGEMEDGTQAILALVILFTYKPEKSISIIEQQLQNKTKKQQYYQATYLDILITQLIRPGLELLKTKIMNG